MRVPALCAVACCLFASDASADTWLVWDERFWPSCTSGSKYLTLLNTTEGRAFCTLTEVGGKFEGGGEYGRLALEGDSPIWVFRYSSCQPGVRFTVNCWRNRW